MRVEERKEKRVVTDTWKVYIADDGTEFDDKKKCERYEIASNIDKAYKDLELIKMDFVAAPLNYDGCVDEEYCQWYSVENKDDYEKVRAYYDACTVNSVYIDEPSSYPSVICVSESEPWSSPYETEDAYGYTLDDMKNTAKEFFENFGIKVSFS